MNVNTETKPSAPANEQILEELREMLGLPPGDDVPSAVRRIYVDLEKAEEAREYAEKFAEMRVEAERKILRDTLDAINDILGIDNEADLFEELRTVKCEADVYREHLAERSGAGMVVRSWAVSDMLARIADIVGRSDDDDRLVAAVEALKKDADVVPELERRIEGLRREIAGACKIIGCDSPDELLPALRRQTSRLERLEWRLGPLEESRSQALR